MIEIDSPPEREQDVLSRTLDLLVGRLPPSWALETDPSAAATYDRGLDAVLRLIAPDGSSTRLAVEAKRIVEARDIPRISEQLARGMALARGTEASQMKPLLAARYLPPRTRERLEDLGIAYADATGNLWLTLDSPALFLRDRGADRDPWRGPGRKRGSFRGGPAGRVVRTLADFVPPVTVPELTERSRTSAGATYRMVELLEREAYIEREPRKAITSVDWRRMLQRWSEDYEFASSNPTARFLEPRGLDRFEEALRGSSPLQYAITGSMAAQQYAPYAPARLAMVYVDSLDRAADRLDLRPVDSGANVLLAAPKDGFVFDRTRTIDGLTYTAPSQTAVDLLTSPGRGPSEGVELLDWMEANEPAWRR